MSDEQIGAVEIDYAGMGIRGVLVEPEALIAYARAVIAEYERINGIAPAAPNVEVSSTDQATNATPEAVCSTAMLGPLPEPAACRYWTTGHRQRWQYVAWGSRHAAPSAEPLFTADQMRAYALAHKDPVQGSDRGGGDCPPRDAAASPGA